MKLTDRRLYQAANIEDFKFRFYFRDEDNYARRNSVREVNAIFQQGFIPPDVHMIWGIDISPWDGHVNLSVTKEYGASFAFIKAMDGTVPANYWADNLKRAQDVGLADGSYAWLYPDNKVSCVLQARAYWDLIKDKNSVLPPVIDFEWTRYAGVAANPNYTDLDKWVTEFTRISNQKPILYSAAGYMNMFGRMPDVLRAKFRGFWFAAYSGVPTLPTGFTNYDIWQFTSFGDAKTLAPGDRNKLELDLNYMAPAFFGMFEPTIPGEPMEQIIKGTALTAVNRRDAPAGNLFSPPRYLQPGDTIEADRNQFQWLHLTRINGVSIASEEWASAGASQQYIRWQWEDVPAEPPPTEPPAGLPDVLWIGETPETVKEYRKAA